RFSRSCYSPPTPRTRLYHKRGRSLSRAPSLLTSRAKSHTLACNPRPSPGGLSPFLALRLLPRANGNGVLRHHRRPAMAGKSLVLTLILCVSAIAARAAKEEMIPAGTLLHCTLDEPNFSAKTAQVGDPVLCHLGPVSTFGPSVFPRGAMLSGHLQDSKNPGHFVGKGWLD